MFLFLGASRLAIITLWNWCPKLFVSPCSTELSSDWARLQWILKVFLAPKQNLFKTQFWLPRFSVTTFQILRAPQFVSNVPFHYYVEFQTHTPLISFRIPRSVIFCIGFSLRAALLSTLGKHANSWAFLFGIALHSGSKWTQNVPFSAKFSFFPKKLDEYSFLKNWLQNQEN